MKKITLLLVVATVMVIALSSVTVAGAESKRPPIIPVLGPGQYVMSAAAYPVKPGFENLAVVWVTTPGKVCFINPYESVKDYGHIKKPAIRRLDAGSWVDNQLSINRTEVSVASGYIRCAEVGAGIWAFQGMH